MPEKEEYIQQNITRNVDLDKIKGIATVLVVFVHAHNIMSYGNITKGNWLIDTINTLANAGVPSFFFISAYLRSRRTLDWKSDILKKCRTLLLPYMMWMAFYVSFEFIGFHLFPSTFSNVAEWTLLEWVKNVIGIPFVTPPIYNPFWFVRDLFLMNLLLPGIRYVLKNIPSGSAYILIGTLWYLPLPGYFRQAVCFYLLGLLIGGEVKRKEEQHANGLGIILVILCMALPNSYILTRTKTIMAVIAVFILGSQISYKKVSVIFEYSFWIYSTHGKCLSILQVLATDIIIQTGITVTLEYFLLPFIVIVTCIITGGIFKRLLPKLYAVLVGGRFGQK